MPRWTLVSPAVVLAAVAVPFNAIIGMNVAKESTEGYQRSTKIDGVEPERLERSRSAAG
jgi:hypothetical protein